jgi:hypothetical protein
MTKRMAKKRKTINTRKNGLYTMEVFIISGPVTEKFVESNSVISRTIEIRGDQTLEDLHYAMFGAFDREEEHLYEFQIGGRGPNHPKAKRYVLPGEFENPMGGLKPKGEVSKTTIISLKLKENESFGYWFDFGDDWWHQISVTSIKEKIPAGRYPRVIKRIGESPPQYPDFEEE